MIHFPIEHIGLILDSPAAFGLKHIGGITGIPAQTFDIDVFQSGRNFILIASDGLTPEPEYFTDIDELIKAITELNDSIINESSIEFYNKLLAARHTFYSTTEDEVDTAAVITLIRRVNALEAATNARLDNLEQSLSERLVEIQAAFSHFTEQDRALRSIVETLKSTTINYYNPQTPIV